ncbi:MAG: VWA domain-containing protein [Gemmataceae bacterium]|nr:VWA domain-containing protein [Gemmataceae bacterium]
MTIQSRRWFLIALTAVFVLSLPALILCFMALTGTDADFNEWLQQNFKVTFSLVLPPLPTILLLLIPPLIILLYFLKLKRKPMQVPSTFLWKKAIEDLHVNSLFQWLRQNILLLLQLLLFVAFLYSLLGFRYHGTSTRANHYILLIDNSASMSATDVSPSRLDWAKQEALREIDHAGDRDVGMVIVFNSKATTLQGYTNNRAKLRDAVRSIEPTQRTTRIQEALSLAESLANPVRTTEAQVMRPPDEIEGAEREVLPPEGIKARVHLFSDGRFAPVSDSVLANLGSREVGFATALGNLNLHYHPAGKPGVEHANNLGIVMLNALRYNPGDAKLANLDVARLQILVRVANYRPRPAQAKLRLDVLQNGKLIHPEQKLLQLPKRTFSQRKTLEDGSEVEEKDEPGETTVTFLLPAFDLRGSLVLHAYLENANDDFDTDDAAWLAIGAVRKAKILIVGPPNAILEAFFEQEAAERLATVERLSAADLTKDAYLKRARSGDVDLVIFDRCRPEPESDMPQANTLFIDDVPPPWRRGTEPVKNPFLLVSKKDHPLLRWITTLYDVGIAEAFLFHPEKSLDPKLKPDFDLPEGDPKRRTLPPLTRILEAGGGVPMMLAIQRGSYTDVVLTFPFVNREIPAQVATNWYREPSLPLFFRNVLYMLGNVDDAVRVLSAQPGEPMILRPEAGIQKLTIHPPGGSRTTLERGPRPEFTHADTDKIGVYKVERDDGATRWFTVNLLDSGESNIQPRDEIAIGSERVAAGEERPQPRDLWKWILVAAVLLLLVEWQVYNRRVAV